MCYQADQHGMQRRHGTAGSHPLDEPHACLCALSADVLVYKLHGLAVSRLAIMLGSVVH